MCGRTGLSLCAADIQAATCYKCSKTDKFSTPKWVDEHNLGKEYKPSHNVAPTDVTPVLVSAKNFGLGEDCDRILKPMMWGMVPQWHKGDYKSHRLTTNNSRIENILSSKMFSPALKKGNRCVVLAEGFYEWKTTDKTATSKQPYYIYMTQEDNVKVEDPSTWNSKFDEVEGWRGIRLMNMAAIYDEWHCEEGILYSYSVITMESDDKFNWLHHRIPAILENDQQITDWLEGDRLPCDVAVSKLKPASKLSWHPVSSLVNNSRNKSPDCNKPVTETNEGIVKKNEKSMNFMMSWLGGSKRKSDGNDDSGRPLKKN